MDKELKDYLRILEFKLKNDENEIKRDFNALIYLTNLMDISIMMNYDLNKLLHETLRSKKAWILDAKNQNYSNEYWTNCYIVDSIQRVLEKN